MSFEQAVIKAKLNDMFNKAPHFSICEINELGRLLGTNPKAHPNYKYLHALHCINYSDMDEEIYSQLHKKCLECLSGKVDTDLMAKALFAVSNGEIKDSPYIEDSYIDNVRKLR